MKFLNLFIGTAHAQSAINSQGNNFNLGAFNNLINPLGTGTNFNTLLGNIIGIILTIAGLAAFIYLLIAGFQYITAGGDADKATKARTGILNALIGIAVIVVAYVILRYVGQNLLQGS